MQMNLCCKLDVCFFFNLYIISLCLSNGVRGLKKSSDPIDFPVVGWSQKVFIFITCRLRLSWSHADVIRVAFSSFEFLQESNPSQRTKRSESHERLYWWGRNCWDPVCFRVWLILSNHHRFALCRCIYFGNSVYEDLSPTKASVLLFIFYWTAKTGLHYCWRKGLNLVRTYKKSEKWKKVKNSTIH